MQYQCERKSPSITWYGKLATSRMSRITKSFQIISHIILSIKKCTKFEKEKRKRKDHPKILKDPMLAMHIEKR
jgi:hypothetical protein